MIKHDLSTATRFLLFDAILCFIPYGMLTLLVFESLFLDWSKPHNITLKAQIPEMTYLRKGVGALICIEAMSKSKELCSQLKLPSKLEYQ